MRLKTRLVRSVAWLQLAAALVCLLPLTGNAQSVQFLAPLIHDHDLLSLSRYSEASLHVAGRFGQFKASIEPLNETTLPNSLLEPVNDPPPKAIEPELDPSIQPRDAINGNESEFRRGFSWGTAFRQSVLFNGILQVYRVTMEPETKAELGGPFFKDYFRSVRSLRGWDDGDNFLTNFIAHPMQGAVAGRIQIHNDPRGVRQEFVLRREYLTSRLKAMSWATLFSVKFELGPLSEASLGNVGMKPRAKSRHPMAFVDLVVTPTVGTAWLIGEDAIDRFLLRAIENRISNRLLRSVLRSTFNPTRSMANILRFKYPWHRDNRSL